MRPRWVQLVFLATLPLLIGACGTGTRKRPVVIDTFSNITGETLKESFIRVPLALFLFFIVMGSYAVLSTFVDSFKSRSIQQILGIGVIECVVLFVEESM